MENQDFRNYTVCAKVTANQKKMYIELATKEGLSLSEWLGSRIDMSIENEIMLKSKRIANKKINHYDNKKNMERDELVHFNNGGIINNFNEQKRITPDSNNFTLQKKLQSEKHNFTQFTKEINAYNSTAKTLNTVGCLAFLGALLLRSN